MTFFEEITKAILEKIPESEVELLDPRADGRHLEVIVICDDFIDRPLIQRHRMILDAVDSFFSGPLHALSIKAYTKKEAKEKL